MTQDTVFSAKNEVSQSHAPVADPVTDQIEYASESDVTASAEKMTALYDDAFRALAQ